MENWRKKDRETSALIASRNAFYDLERKTLAEAAKANNTSEMNRLWIRTSAPYFGVDGRNLLMWAASGCAVDAVRYLLEHEASSAVRYGREHEACIIDWKDDLGKTALDYVSCKSETSGRKIKALLQSGAHKH
jgi:ankyrin repeat protein